MARAPPGLTATTQRILRPLPPRGSAPWRRRSGPAWWLGLGLMGLLLGAGCGLALLDGPLFVDAIEEDRVQLIRLDTGALVTLPLSALPPGAREGDVLVKGRAAPTRAQALRRELAARRARLRAADEALEVSPSRPRPLTGRQEW